MAAHEDVIEFQKRGLPQAHFLIILQHEDEILNADLYDGIISAKIPDDNH